MQAARSPGQATLAFTVAASMGTVNELLELGYDQVQGTTLSADTSWDLLANSVGAVTAALLIELIIASSGMQQRFRRLPSPG